MQVTKLDHQLHILDDGRVRAFLIAGGDSALLIDTGFADSQVYETVKTITDLPVTVLLTHADPDHAGGLIPFGACCAMEPDWPMIPQGVSIHSLNQGAVFCCGEYRLEVIPIPGHTRGSAAFFDREKGLLISGDSVQKDGPIFMFGPHRNLDQYIESQKKLVSLAPSIRTILPSHHPCPIGPEYIEANLLDALDLKAGKLPSQPHPNLPCRICQGKSAAFLY